MLHAGIYKKTKNVLMNMFDFLVCEGDFLTIIVKTS